MARKKILEIACQAGISCARTLETVYAGKAMVYEDNTVKVVPDVARPNRVKVGKRIAFLYHCNQLFHAGLLQSRFCFGTLLYS